jgi:hypothetical protein
MKSGQCHTPANLPQEKNPDINRISSWVHPRASTDMSGDGKISVQDMNPRHYTNYIALALVVRYIVTNNFKDISTFIFMGKLARESEEFTVIQNSGNYTTNSIVSHPKGPKSLPMPL